MRKRYHDKDRVCALCKPQKRGQAIRWKPRDLVALREAEKVVRLASYR